jgi:hypothetical protein
MAYKFKNNTGKHKFTGTFGYNSLNYEYILYLPELIDPERSEVIRKFGNRMQKGKACLDISEADIGNYIDTGSISAYIIINEVGSDETASGTLQIYDWCSGNKKQLLANAFVWINDVCRILGPSGVKTTVSPVGALFYFMEQLTIQNIKKQDIYLFVDTHDETNKTVLTSIYSKNYGFTVNSEDDVTLCPANGARSDLMTMKKPSLVADTTGIDFSFLMKRLGGGKNKKPRTIRRRKSLRGSGFTEDLRNKTSRTRKNSTIKNPPLVNRRNRFVRQSRSYLDSTQEREPINEWKEQSYSVTNKYGPNESAFYAGPVLQNDYLYQTQKVQPIPHGKDGTVIYSTGHVYKGDFNKGKREGHGTLVIKDGKIKGPIYEGEWKDDKFVPFTDWKNANKK